jgi:hypothetical protein
MRIFFRELETSGDLILVEHVLAQLLTLVRRVFTLSRSLLRRSNQVRFANGRSERHLMYGGLLLLLVEGWRMRFFQRANWSYCVAIAECGVIRSAIVDVI